MSVTEDGFVIRHSGRADLWPAAAGQPYERPVMGGGLDSQLAGARTVAASPVPATAEPGAGAKTAELLAQAQAASLAAIEQAAEAPGPQGAMARKVLAAMTAPQAAEEQAAG